jgi:ribosomal protein S14
MKEKSQGNKEKLYPKERKRESIRNHNRDERTAEKHGEREKQPREN